MSRLVFPWKGGALNRPVDLETWRVWFAHKLILLGAVLFPLGAAFSLPQQLSDGHSLLPLINLAAWGVLLLRCFAKPEAYRGNATAILMLLYILTVTYFVTLGPDHARPAWLVVCAVLSALMFGLRGAVGAILLNVVLLLTLYEVLGPENSEWAAEFQKTYYNWVLFVINVTLLTIISSLPVGYMLMRLDKSLKYEREVRKRLSKKGERLKDANRALAREVELRRETEEILREREAYHRILFEEAPDGYYLFDQEGRVVDINRAMEKIQGYRKEESIGKRFYEIGVIAEESATGAIEKFKKQLQGECLGPFERVLKRKDGQYVTVELNTFPVMARGRLHLIGIARDVTMRKQAEVERKKLENRLMRAQKMEAIGTLAGGIAHDFNNILAGVIGYAELALSNTGDRGELEYLLSGVLKAGNRARDLARQILAFSRYETDSKFGPVNVKAVTQDVLKLMRATLPATIEIRSRLESDAFVLADPVQLHQVLMNLCTNSGQAMREKGGLLEVRMSNVVPDSVLLKKIPELTPVPHVALVVTDTGKGIAPDVMGKIFDPYFTTKLPEEGSGLGLAIVHGIVKNIGGILWAESEPDRETAFHIYLPAVEKVSSADGDPETELPTGSERVLLVDDEPVIVEVGQTILGRLGYRVTARTSSVEALELFQRDPEAFDLVITDMTMPVFTGKALAERMMTIRPDIPIILCTGFSHQIDRDEAMEMSFRAFVLKPFNLRKIAGAVRNALDEAFSGKSAAAAAN